MRALLTLGLLAGIAMPSASQAAEDWQDFAMVSTTMGTQMNRLCAGADNSDLGCPSYAPSLTTAGHVSVTGNLSAVKFIGDGSALTGLTATTDRIVSDTTSIIANDGMDTISFTTAGTARMVINASGNVGIGTTAPSAPLHISATQAQIVFTTASGGKGYVGRLSDDNIYLWNNSPSSILLGTSNTERVRIASSGNVGIGTTNPNAKLQVSGSMIVSTTGQTTTPSLYVGTDGNVGIGTGSPQSALDILSAGLSVRGRRGTSVATTVLPTQGTYIGWNEANGFGRTHFMNHRGGGQGGWEFNGYNTDGSYYGTSAALNHDGLLTLYSSTAGTESSGVGLVASQGGAGDAFVSWVVTGRRWYAGIDNSDSDKWNLATTAGTPSFDTDTKMTVDVSGKVGIGTTSPGQTLDVSGTARIVSRTIIGSTATPSATLQVSGSLLLAGSDSTTCNDAYIGILRRNPTTGRLQVCK